MCVLGDETREAGGIDHAQCQKINGFAQGIERAGKRGTQCSA